LAERSFAGEQLGQIRRMIDAEASDLFDVLRYIAFTRAPLKRSERARARRGDILLNREPGQAEFLEFVLSQYVHEGEGELDAGKLPHLLELKYGTPQDAVQQLGSATIIRETFRDFQRGLYEAD
jgi:type I restriction enzyme, R subunit